MNPLDSLALWIKWVPSLRQSIDMGWYPWWPKKKH